MNQVDTTALFIQHHNPGTYRLALRVVLCNICTDEEGANTKPTCYSLPVEGRGWFPVWRGVIGGGDGGGGESAKMSSVSVGVKV